MWRIKWGWLRIGWGWSTKHWSIHFSFRQRYLGESRGVQICFYTWALAIYSIKKITKKDIEENKRRMERDKEEVFKFLDKGI